MSVAVRAAASSIRSVRAVLDPPFQVAVRGRRDWWCQVEGPFALCLRRASDDAVGALGGALQTLCVMMLQFHSFRYDGGGGGGESEAQETQSESYHTTKRMEKTTLGVNDVPVRSDVGSEVDSVAVPLRRHGIGSGQAFRAADR